MGGIYNTPGLLYRGVWGVGFSSVLLQQHHLPCLDEIDIGKVIEVDIGKVDINLPNIYHSHLIMCRIKVMNKYQGLMCNITSGQINGPRSAMLRK